MNAPGLLIGAALAFWSWQTGLWPAGLAMAAVLEGSRMVRRRWDFSRADFIRVSDLCTVLFVTSTAYFYSTQPATAAFMSVSRFLPMTLFFLMSAQAYSTQAKVDVAALALSWRARGTAGPRGQADISYPYLILCVVCASTANIRGWGFYAGMVALCGWALWGAKPRRTATPAWAALFLLAAGLGYAGQSGLHGLQNSLEKNATDWLFGTAEAPTDPYLSRTAIGRIGALKQSGEIVLRVKTDSGGAPPPLLREASYDRYRQSQWHAKDAPFSLLRGGEGDAWDISLGNGQRWASVSQNFHGGEGMLALPLGTFRVSGLYAGTLNRNRFGAVKITAAPRWGTYRASFGGSAADTTPAAPDLALPAEEEAAFARLAGELHLKGLGADSALKTAEAYFEKNFTYSTYQAELAPKTRPLENFLFKTRSGHCELFATSAVLLLREAGIPARYATGWSLQEYSRLEKSYVVRQRHAHAWALAFVDGAWRDFDVTPPSWGEVERRRGKWGEPIDDLLSWAQSRLDLWRWRKKEGLSAKTLGWILIPLVAFALWRFTPRVKGVGAAEREPVLPRPESPGRDSEWYAVESEMEKSGLGRRPEESPGDWAGRVGLDSLAPLLGLHYRHRFDPEGINKEDREALRAGVLSWLASRQRSLK